MRTKEGNSRMFGFVGFRTPAGAAAAAAHFARTYMDTKRCAALNEPTWRAAPSHVLTRARARSPAG